MEREAPTQLSLRKKNVQMEHTSLRVIQTNEMEEVVCSVKKRFGKCVLPLATAIVCLSCHCIHMGTQCPNCRSLNNVRLVELTLDAGDITGDELERLISRKLSCE